MINWTNLFLQEVLSNDRLDLLEKFKEIKKLWFYLAWWTALALLFWHRKSVDFDFFINKDFNENQLFDKMLYIFSQEQIKKTFTEKNTLYIEVNWIKISFFGYKYKLIDKLVKTEYFDLANIKDIWAMKFWAIQKRATNKDYVDLYYILQKIDIWTLLDSFFKKYWNVISETILLKSLIYFDDVEDEKLALLDKNINFEKIKNYLIEQVRNYEINFTK